jgi:hypothetical protein
MKIFSTLLMNSENLNFTFSFSYFQLFSRPSSTTPLGTNITKYIDVVVFWAEESERELDGGEEDWRDC